MKPKLITLAFVLVLSAGFAASADDWLPPVEWGVPPDDVISQPYLCKGPLAVDDDVEVHLCTLPVFGREAIVGLYFVDGSYACFQVTMATEGGDADQIRRDFDGVVDHVDRAVGRAGGRDGGPGGEPRATWLTQHETIRAAIQNSGSTPLIGIVGLAPQHHARIARLVSW
jgi:hypothetical protein